MNYMQQQYAPRPTINAYNNNGWNNTNRVRPVSSIEEVRAASIDFDGSVFYFPDLANKRIYTKQINLDGTASLNMYELKETPIMEQPFVDSANFVTRQEFESVIAQLKEIMPMAVQAPVQAKAAPAQTSAAPEPKAPAAEFKF